MQSSQIRQSQRSPATQEAVKREDVHRINCGQRERYRTRLFHHKRACKQAPTASWMDFSFEKAEGFREIHFTSTYENVATSGGRCREEDHCKVRSDGICQYSEGDWPLDVCSFRPCSLSAASSCKSSSASPVRQA